MKNNKGFTLVEIIVVLVIIAILAAATIPSMLGFVDQAKSKAIAAEARAVYIAAQAYVTEKIATETINDATFVATLNGSVSNSSHVLKPYIQDDADGIISGTKISATGKVIEIVYTKGNQSVNFSNGRANFGTVAPATYSPAYSAIYSPRPPSPTPPSPRPSSSTPPSYT